MELSTKTENKNSTSYELVVTELEAWVGILYSCISADNHIKESERESLFRLLEVKQKFAGVDIAPIYVQSLHSRTEFGATKYLSSCCEVIKEEDKETVFALSLEILLSDGLLGDEEKSIIEILAKQLTLEPAMVSKIIEVIFLKNKGNIKSK